MKVGVSKDCDTDIWQGRSVYTSHQVLVDGKPTSLKIPWFDPDNDTYGFFVTDGDGRPQIHPNNPDELWVEVGRGKVTLEFEADF